MKFKSLIEQWKKSSAPQKTAREYAIRLALDDAARLAALSEFFPRRSVEASISDILHAGL